MPKLKSAEVAAALNSLPAWKRQGRAICRTLEFADFPAAIRFVNGMARLAEDAAHHPDIDIRWNRVTLTLTTHDAGGLTEKDLALARQLDALALRPKAKRR